MIEIIKNKKYKKIYLSGPITGIENNNEEEFEKYEDKFLNLGIEVVNPLKLFSKYEIEELYRKLIKGEITQEEHWSIFMKRDIPEMIKCNVVAALKNWNKSRGANIEIKLATDLYIPVVDSETLIELF